MSIKHLPSGLFPHFNCGFERRPYLVRMGQTMQLGCRLDESSADSVDLEIQDARGCHRIAGNLCGTNDRGQRYYSFIVETEQSGDFITYRFVTSNGDQSKEYVCPLLRELILRPEKIWRESDRLHIAYEPDAQRFRVDILTSSYIMLVFSSNLTDKVCGFCPIDGSHDLNCAEWDQGKLILRVSKDVCFRLEPSIQLLVDSKNRVYQISFQADMPGNAFYGLGEKYDRVNQRGLKPHNYVVEKYTNQQETTYFPVPFLFSDAGVSFRQIGTYPSIFDLSGIHTDGYQRVAITSRCPMQGILFEATIHEGTTAQLLKAYSDETGKPALPPIWAFGPWMSSNGWNTQKEAEEQIRQMKQTAIPATVMVLEAWSDEETFYIWNDAEYEPSEDDRPLSYRQFTFPKEGKWPNPKAFTQGLEDSGVKLILWQIPVIKHEERPHGRQLDMDEAYAIEHGLCIKNKDGTPYRITEMWFANSLIPDFSNEETCKWWFNKRRYLVEELHVAGFKTDGGEFLFEPESRLADGREIAEAHNDFPNLYVGAYHSFLEQTVGKGNGVTFSRAGYTGAQKYPIHWGGDQASTFSELRGQLTAGLSLGLSGVPFWGFDIGGLAGELPSTELYLRSAAMAAFSPVMQFHSEPRNGQYNMTERKNWNNDRSPWNMTIANRDERILKIYRLFAHLRMNLLPYIWQEAIYCSETTRPMMAHLIYDFLGTDGRVILDIEDQYMFGRSLLVAPIVEERALSREIYLPIGKWYDFWSGDLFGGGQKVQYLCDLDRIPVFVRSGSILPVNLNQRLCMGSQTKEGQISNRVDQYERLSFLLYGQDGQMEFSDNFGNKLIFNWEGGQLRVSGKSVMPVIIFHMGAEGLLCPGARKVEGKILGRRTCGWELPEVRRSESAEGLG